MENLLESMHPSESPKRHDLCSVWIHELKKLMQSFHHCDLVHGDLCEPNILCNGKTVMLIGVVRLDKHVIPLPALLLS